MIELISDITNFVTEVNPMDLLICLLMVVGYMLSRILGAIYRRHQGAGWDGNPITDRRLFKYSYLLLGFALLSTPALYYSDSYINWITGVSIGYLLLLMWFTVDTNNGKNAHLRYLWWWGLGYIWGKDNKSEVPEIKRLEVSKGAWTELGEVWLGSESMSVALLMLYFMFLAI